MAIYGIIGCGHCSACLRGRDNECRVKPVGGIGISRDGGMADYIMVPASQLLAIGDLDVAQAAPLTDAGLTPYHAIQITRSALLPGATCVVIGVGGLGHMAVQILAATHRSSHNRGRCQSGSSRPCGSDRGQEPSERMTRHPGTSAT